MPSTTPTRREFVATTSLAFAGTLLRTHGLCAQLLPASIGRSGFSANALFPDSATPLDFRGLAARALEAATHAGASYADIRIGDHHALYVNGGGEPDINLRSTLTYGVRVLVDGAWAFAYGRNLTVDAVTASARQAVVTARGYASLVVRRAELAPAPVVIGEWATPIHEDPFTVPLHDHAAVLHSYGWAGSRVNRVREGYYAFKWTKETRVFASSEGTLITQTLRTLEPEVIVPGNFLDPHGMGGVEMRYPGLRAQSGGFELGTDPAIPNGIKQWTEEVARIAALPWGTLDVGRYPVVFDGCSLGVMLGTTLGRALEMDRVLGDEAGASGTSFLSPMDEVLGTAIASPLLTVAGHRAMPSPVAVKWDDEGAEAHTYPLITDGRLVDYHTSRQSALALESWYAQQRQPMRSHGCATVPRTDTPVMVRAPHLTVSPSHSPTNVETLCQGLTRGLLVMDMPACSTDYQLTSLFYQIPGPPITGAPTLEIERGRPVRRVARNALDVNAKRFWKEQLVALGDTSTVEATTFEVYKGMPWQQSTQCMTAPAALFKDVNVSVTG